MFLDRREQSTKVRGGFSLHLHSSLDFVGLGGLQTMHTLRGEEHTEKKILQLWEFLTNLCFWKSGHVFGKPTKCFHVVMGKYSVYRSKDPKVADSKCFLWKLFTVLRIMEQIDICGEALGKKFLKIKILRKGERRGVEWGGGENMNLGWITKSTFKTWASKETTMETHLKCRGSKQPQWIHRQQMVLLSLWSTW